MLVNARVRRTNGSEQKQECVELFKDALDPTTEEHFVRGPGSQKMKGKDRLCLFLMPKYFVFALSLFE